MGGSVDAELVISGNSDCSQRSHRSTALKVEKGPSDGIDTRHIPWLGAHVDAPILVSQLRVTSPSWSELHI